MENPSVIWMMAGLYVFLLGLFYFQRRLGKKKYLFDERYRQETNQAKARAWDVSLVIMLLAWPVVIIFDGIGFSFFLLTGIFVLHNTSLMVTSFYLGMKNL